MKCVVLDSREFISDLHLIDSLYENFDEVQLYQGLPADEEEALERAKDADVLVFAIMHLSNDFLSKLPKLKIIQFIGTGYTTFLDVDYAKSLGIQLLNIEGYGSNAVAEFTLGQIFGAVRYMAAGDRLVRSGVWDKGSFEGAEVENSTIGVIGTGNIGEIVAKKLSLLGAKVLGYDLIHKQNLIDDYGVEYMDNLTELAKRCTILTIHLKVNEETTRMINREVIYAMPEGSYLVNIARAEIVDTDALYDALKSGQLRYAATDVYDQEPPAGNKLLELENITLSPHIGFYSKRASDNAILMMSKSIIDNLDNCGKNGNR